MASIYDKEYFYNFDDYKKLEENQPIPLGNWNDFKFDFYQINFKNGVRVYLFNTLKEAYEYNKYLSLDNVPYLGKIDEIIDRVIFEALKRSSRDFIELCNQLAENRTFCFIYVPFKLSWQEI